MEDIRAFYTSLMNYPSVFVEFLSEFGLQNLSEFEQNVNCRLAVFLRIHCGKEPMFNLEYVNINSMKNHPRLCVKYETSDPTKIAKFLVIEVIRDFAMEMPLKLLNNLSSIWSLPFHHEISLVLEDRNHSVNRYLTQGLNDHSKGYPAEYHEDSTPSGILDCIFCYCCFCVYVLHRYR